MESSAYKHGTHSALKRPALAFISTPWPLLLSAAYRAKTQHLDSVQYQKSITNAQPEQQQRRRWLLHWKEKLNLFILQRVEGWERSGVEGVYSTSLFVWSHVVFMFDLPTIQGSDDKRKRKKAVAWTNIVIKLQEFTTVFPGRCCAPARCRKRSAICWPAAVLHFLQLCLQPIGKRLWKDKTEEELSGGKEVQLKVK